MDMGGRETKRVKRGEGGRESMTREMTSFMWRVELWIWEIESQITSLLK